MVGLDTRGVLDHGRESSISRRENVRRLAGAVANIGVHASLVGIIDALDHLEWVDSDENLADIGLVRRAWSEKGVTQVQVN